MTTIDFRAIVLAEMERRELSARALESECGLPSNTLTKWLNGTHESIASVKLEDVLAVLDVEVRAPARKRAAR